MEDTQVTEVSEPKTERESPKTVAETHYPGMNIAENSETATQYAVPREITEETEVTESTGIPQATLVDPTKDTETDVSEQIVAEQVVVTHTIDISELVTGTPANLLRENEESTTTSPGSPQRKNPEVQNKSRDSIEVNTEQTVKRTHKCPKTNNSIVNKIFSAFRQAKESLDIIPM